MTQVIVGGRGSCRERSPGCNMTQVIVGGGGPRRGEASIGGGRSGKGQDKYEGAWEFCIFLRDLGS